MASGVVPTAPSARRASGERRAARVAPIRLGRRTKALAPTLAPGAIVVLDHPDLDSVAAQALARARPRAVLNNQPFVTGRYPNQGPRVLLDTGIPLYETDPAVDLFALLKDREPAWVDRDRLRRPDGTMIAELLPLEAAELTERLAAARENLDAELAGFAQNTLRYLERPEERALLLDPVTVPETAAVIAGRHVLVVVRGEGYEQDLQRLSTYLREQKPVVVAVDGAADALLALGIRPQILLGDMDSVSDAALRACEEVIVHAYPPGRAQEAVQAPGLERVHRLGRTATVFPVAGTSEDAALLLAYEKGADLIVAVGTHSNLEDFLDKGRGGMASTFLVRLKVGRRLVDARGVSRLYSGRRRVGPLLAFLALSALFPIGVLTASTPFGQIAWRAIVVWWRLHLHG